MSNMSYCRFENTMRDLRDCEGALEELFNNGHEEDELSREHELPSAKELVKTCQRILEMVADRADKPVEDLTEDDIDAVMNEANEEAEASKEREEELDAEEKGR